MAAKERWLALSGLLAGATVWGLIWYPYRALAQEGVHGIAAATLTYGVALALGLVTLRTAWRETRFSWALILIALAAGGCNLGYVLATLEGEVVRVLLLFYLAPLWTVLLSWLILDERLRWPGAAVIALSLAGAAVMLWRPELGLPVPRNRAEWVGVASGFLFALSNVLVRKTAYLSIELKCLAVFLGVTLLGCLLLATGWEVAPLTGYTIAKAQTWALVAIVGATLLAINLVVQYGLTHTPANQASVIFLFELVVAAVGAWLLANEVMGAKEWVGGAMIVFASLFSGVMAEHGEAQSVPDDSEAADGRTTTP